MNGAGTGTVVLAVDDLVVRYPIRSQVLRRVVGAVHAVDGVSLEVAAGETLALVGESGCGKSSLAKTIIGAQDASAGDIAFRGERLPREAHRRQQGHRRGMQLITQDPYGSLNPRMRVGDIIEEPLIVHRSGDRADRRRRVLEAMDMVGLSPDHATRYPHEFSGGQRQRIGIARALILRPSLLILDEPVSALDVSVQAQILNLLRTVQDEIGMACLLISHDLSVVRYVAHRVAVMYLGRIVETGATEQLYEHPSHPYTRALLSAVPVPDPGRARKIIDLQLGGDLPDPLSPPSGCRFRTRCSLADAQCASEPPPRLVARPGVDHPVACHHVDRLDAVGNAV